MSKLVYAIISIFCMITLLTWTVRYMYSQNDYINRSFLEQNINRASDYAMFNMLANTDDIKADYIDFGKIDVNPQVCYDTFKRYYCLMQYGSDSKDVMRRFAADFVCGIILTYDGYYVFESETNISLKIPYLYNKYREGVKFQYFSTDTENKYLITLSSSTMKQINLSTGVSTEKEMDETEKDEIIRQLEDTISREINIRIANFYSQTREPFEMYVPFFRKNIEGVNAIDSITAIWVMNAPQGLSYKPLISVSGSTVILNRFMLGYEREGVKYYTSFKNKGKLDNLGVQVQKMFKDKKTAAKLGFTYDIRISSMKTD